MLGFTRVGAAKTNEAVNAPAQLMWLNVADIRRRIDQHAGRAEDATRSLYAHFFSAKEEAGIYQRLAGLGEAAPDHIPAPFVHPSAERAQAAA
jgi:hypothetical protein